MQECTTLVVYSSIVAYLEFLAFIIGNHLIVIPPGCVANGPAVMADNPLQCSWQDPPQHPG